MADPQDPLTALLTKAPIGASVRADAWDAYQQASSEDDLAAKLQKLPMPQETKAALWDLKHQGAPPPPPPDEGSAVSRFVKRAADYLNPKTVLNGVGAAMPTVGGIVGGIVGGVPGAALGGAAGEGYKQLLTHATELPGAVVDVARNLVTQPEATLKGFAQGKEEGARGAVVEGGLMAAGEGVGSAVVKGATSLGKVLMENAAGPTMALAREFPELSQTMIDNALTVSKNGLNKARAILKSYKATANASLDAAHAAGATVPVTAATNGLEKTFDDLVMNSSDPVGGLTKLANISTRIRAGRAADLTMHEADALKTGLQNEVKSLYKSLASGNSSRSLALEANAKADMAAALNQSIEDITTKAGAPGYKAANASAQELIGATRAIARRLLQRGTTVTGALSEAVTPATIGGALGGPMGAAAATAGKLGVKAATAPVSLSHAAVYLNNPAVQAFLRQLPKPALDAIKGLIGGGASQ